MIAWFATKGSGTNEAARMDTLLSGFSDRVEWRFDKGAKVGSFFNLLHRLRRERPSLVVMEGTGIAGGMICLLGRLIWKVSYVVSSGDAVGPFVAAHVPWVAPLFHLYERVLCRYAAGFIGWTPYLCGRAMTFGCPRAVTAAGWPIGGMGSATADAAGRVRRRKEWGVPADAMVVGLVGSLEWNRCRSYAYGLELVRAVARVKNPNVVVVVIGGGSGLAKLKEEAGGLLGTRIFLPGPVELAEVMPCLSAFDLASLPQSIDGVGAFRYTTKLSEYAAARLPVITSRIPAAYDLGTGWMWRLPGEGPWDEIYIDSMTALLERLTTEDLKEKVAAIPETLEAFQRDAQIERVTDFLKDIHSP